MMHPAGFVTLTTWLVVTCLARVHGSCMFPPTMYNTYRPWQIRSPDYDSNVTHLHRLVTVVDQRMVFDYVTKIHPEEATLAFTYLCEEVFDNNRFLVSVVRVGQPTTYTCVQFVIRDTNVVQLKRGKSSAVKSSFSCISSALELMDSPLVYYQPSDEYWKEKRNEGQRYKPCPLEGGYIVEQIFDEDDNALCSGVTVPPLKIENECERGEGLLFHHVGGTRSDACPELSKDIHLQKFCLSNWTHGEDTYLVVLSMTDATDIPCIRYKTRHGDRFSLYVFYDGICDMTPDISGSRQYRRFSLRRFAVDEGVCGDESPDCAFPERSPLCQESEVNQVCRDTCKACPEVAPWEQATNPAQYRGAWIKHTRSQGKEVVTIDKNTLTIPSFGTYSTFGESGCWSAREMISKSAREYIMVQKFDNGCSPRVTAVQLAARSKAVISIKMSNPGIILPELTYSEINKKWLLQDGWEWWCLQTDYKAAPVNQGEELRPGPSNWQNLVSTSPSPPTVRCHMNHTVFHITLQSGDVCTAEVIHTDRNDSFDLSFPSCRTAEGLPSPSRPPTTRFLCLAVFSVDYDATLLITKTPQEHANPAGAEFLCWVFSSDNNDVVNWMRISECDSSSAYYVQIGLREPLLQLRIAEQTALSANGHGAIQSVLTLVTSMIVTFILG